MGTIEVIHPGVLSSVQDTGRDGFRTIGVPISGAFDQISLRLGNRLLGNAEDDAAIEMTMSGSVFRFHSRATICITGAVPIEAMITDGDRYEHIQHNQPIEVPAGCTVKIGRFEHGMRGYLCVAGGIQCPLVLESRSSLVSMPEVGLGCALKQSDRLPIDEQMVSEFDQLVQEHSSVQRGPVELRIVPGAHHQLFDKEQHEAIGALKFLVSDQSNRAGVRLVGERLPGDIPAGIPSEGTLAGYIQVPPSGEPIILGVDGPTTGGYPVIGSVIEADLPKLAQCGLREQITFRWVLRGDAQSALRDQLSKLRSTRQCHPVRAAWDREKRQPQVYLSCDTGESPKGPQRDQELALLPYVTAASIACGGHAGDEDSMRQAISAAKQHGCFIGAHPSYPDQEHFGRTEMKIDHDTLLESLIEQLSVFSKIAHECDARVSYIKAHGALYHRIAHDVAFARWYWDLCVSVIPNACFVGPMGSVSLVQLRTAGVPVLAEGFCDRVYESDGSLRSRNLPGACITEPETATAQAERLVAKSGCRFLCVHSDTMNAVRIAQAVDAHLSDL
jgi:biotin-dependent carboxylase-like uncharacterized protein